MAENDLKECRICGKEFAVLYPNRWAYKRSNNKNGQQFDYFCSWKCLRADEARRAEKKKKVIRIEKELTREKEELAEMKRREQKDVARGVLEAIEKGENPREYLKRIGYANPTDQLANLKRWAEKNEPETAEKLKALAPVKKGPPKGTPAKKAPEKKPAAEVKRARKLPKAARPKPMKGGEWIAARALTREEHEKVEAVNYLDQVQPTPLGVPDFIPVKPKEKGNRIRKEDLKTALDEIALECMEKRVTMIGMNDADTLMFVNAQVAAQNTGVMEMRQKTEEVLSEKWGV